MIMRVGNRLYDADVRENGRAFRVRETIQPPGLVVTDTIQTARFNHSIVKKSKRGKGGG